MRKPFLFFLKWPVILFHWIIFILSVVVLAKKFLIFLKQKRSWWQNGSIRPESLISRKFLHEHISEFIKLSWGYLLETDILELACFFVWGLFSQILLKFLVIEFDLFEILFLGFYFDGYVAANISGNILDLDLIIRCLLISTVSSQKFLCWYISWQIFGIEILFSFLQTFIIFMKTYNGFLLQTFKLILPRNIFTLI